MTRTTTWSRVGALDPRAPQLTAARLEAHGAAQPLAAAAYAVLPTTPDHDHSNLLWSPEDLRFVGRPLPGGQRVFLDPARLHTGLVDAAGRPVTVLELEGRTLEQAFADLARRLADVGQALSGPLTLPAYDLPDSAWARGGPIGGAESGALAELTRWLGNGHDVLSELSARHLGGAEVRGWPHHFDLAALLTLDPDVDPEQARSVGVGLSPGDGSYAEPYFYVSPWPAPDPAELPALPAGAHWHTEGFTSAVLPGHVIVDGGNEPDVDGPTQRARVVETLDALVRAARGLVEAEARAGGTDAGGALGR